MGPLQDEGLKRAFQAMRETDRRRAPDFEDVTDKARSTDRLQSQDKPAPDSEPEQQRERQRRARKDVEHLVELEPAARRKKIENARTRFRSREFVETLLEEARVQVRHGARNSADLASLVPVAIERMGGEAETDWALRMTCLAMAVQANSVRILGHLATADRLFQELPRRLNEDPIMSPRYWAEILLYQASLRVEQRRYDEAEDLLDRAIVHQRRAQDTQGLAKSLILLGQINSATGSFDKANDFYSKVIALLDSDEEPFLVQCAVTGQINALCDLKSFDRAEELLETHRHLYDGHDIYCSTVLRGLEGEIASGRGHWTEAAAAHTEVKDALLEIGREHDAALVCLHIARAMLEQGRIAEVTEMAAEVLEIFRARGADQEALSALILLQEAAASRNLNSTILGEIRRHLKSQTG